VASPTNPLLDGAAPSNGYPGIAVAVANVGLAVPIYLEGYSKPLLAGQVNVRHRLDHDTACRLSNRCKISDRPLGVSQQEATVLPKKYESSDQKILASGRTVALPPYYRSHDAADAGAREPGS
jgi:hypothetical protein